MLLSIMHSFKHCEVAQNFWADYERLIFITHSIFQALKFSVMNTHQFDNLYILIKNAGAHMIQ